MTGVVAAVLLASGLSAVPVGTAPLARAAVAAEETATSDAVVESAEGSGDGGALAEGNYVPLAQTLLADTRSGTGVPQQPLSAGSAVSVQVTGVGGVPASGVEAVALQVDTVSSSQSSWLQVWPSGTTRPSGTTHSTLPGKTLSNIAFVAPGADGRVSVQLGGGQTDFVLRATGYFTDDGAGGGFSPVAQQRVVDTRSGLGAPVGQVAGGGGSVTVSVSGAGVPDAATAVMVNFTLLSPSNGYVTAGQPGGSLANRVAVNYAPGASAAGKVVPVDAGAMVITNHGAEPIHVLVDVQGFVGAADAGGGYTPSQGRVYDSREEGSSSVPATGTLRIPVTGQAGIPSRRVGAVMLAVTVATPAAGGHLQIWPDGQPRPSGTSDVNFVAGQTRTNTVIKAMADPATGSIVVYNSTSTPVDVVVDAEGWFSPYYDPEVGDAFPGGPGERSFFTFTEFGLTDRTRLRVNAASGNALYSAGDVRVAGRGQDLAVGRHYNSRVTATGAFGPGWSIDAAGDIELVAGTGSAAGAWTLHGPTGYRATFTPRSGGGWAAPPGLDASLTQTADGYQVRFERTGETWRFTSTGRLTSRADRNGNTLTYTGSSQLSAITDTRGRDLTFTWTDGRVTAITDVTGRQWTYTYTAGRLTGATDPAGQTTTYAYGANGVLSRITGPRGVVTNLTSDTDGRVVAVDRPLAGSSGGPSTTFDYQDGRTRVDDDNGHRTSYLYDTQGRVGDVIDARGNVRSTTYTANSNVASYTPATQSTGGTPVSNTYSSDGRNNLTGTQLPTGASSTFAYTDPDNRFAPSQYTTPQGNSITYDYDAAGNLAGVTDSTTAAGQTSIARNPDGTLATVTDPGGATTSYTYNSDGELTGIDHPAPLGDETLEYDALSRLSARVDGNGQRLEYTYDPLDRLTAITGPDGLAVTYGYDSAGNRTTLSDPHGTQASTYDALNRVTEESQPEGTATYSYDGVGNLLTLADPAGEVTYAYNAVNLVETITDPTGAVIGFDYDPDNNRTRTTYPNGVTQDATYDASSRLTRITGTRDDGYAAPVTLTDFAYTYTAPNDPGTDTALRHTVTDHTGEVTAYTYDQADRLTRALTRTASGATAATYDYGYDAASNRTTSTTDGALTTYAYNDANQLCWTATASPAGDCTAAPAGATTYAYDANGNQTSTSTGLATTYNAFDQATTITAPGGTARPVTYRGTTQNQRLTNIDSQAGTTRSYQNLHTILGLTARTQTYPQQQTDGYTRDPNGQVLARRSATTREYYLADGLGSIAALTDATGTTTRRYDYDPYGTTTSALGTGFDTNPWRYTGEHQDNNTSLYNIGARTYQPTLGRWTQTDPLTRATNPAQPPEANPYTYVGCNPTNYTDPTGTHVEAALGCLTGVTSATIGVLTGGSTLALLGTGIGTYGIFTSCEPGEGSPLYGVQDAPGCYTNSAGVTIC